MEPQRGSESHCYLCSCRDSFSEATSGILEPPDTYLEIQTLSRPSILPWIPAKWVSRIRPASRTGFPRLHTGPCLRLYLAKAHLTSTSHRTRSRFAAHRGS